MGAERQDYIMIGILITDEEVKELSKRDDGYFWEGEPYKYSISDKGKDGITLVGICPMNSSEMVFGKIIQSVDYMGLDLQEIEFTKTQRTKLISIKEQNHILNKYHEIFGLEADLSSIKLYIFTRWS